MSRSLGTSCGDVAVADHDRALGALLQPGQHPQRGRLAAARRADEHHELAVLDLEVERVDGRALRAGVAPSGSNESHRCHRGVPPVQVSSRRTRTAGGVSDHGTTRRRTRLVEALSHFLDGKLHAAPLTRSVTDVMVIRRTKVEALSHYHRRPSPRPDTRSGVFAGRQESSGAHTEHPASTARHGRPDGAHPHDDGGRVRRRRPTGQTTDGKIKLTVATFNEFGYEELIEEYNAMQDEVMVEQKKAGTSNEHQDNLYTKLAAGSGLSDIEAIEVDWLAELMQYSDAFVDLSDPEVEGRWLDWKTEAATTAGRRAHRLRHRHRPRGHLLPRRPVREGRPADRPRGGRRALRRRWDDYFEAGRQFVKKVPDVAWFDASGATAQAMINQVEYAFEDEDNTVIAADNPEVKEVFDTVTVAGRGGPVRQPRAVERGLDRVLPERRLRHHALPRLDARRHRGQRRGRRGLGHRQRLPRRRRQLGRLLPDRPGAGRAPRGGPGAGRVADRSRAADQGVRGEGHVPEPGRGAARTRSCSRATNAFFNDAPTGADPRRARRGGRRSSPTRARSSPTSTPRSSRPSSASTRARSRPTRPGSPSSPTSSGWADPSPWTLDSHCREARRGRR